MKLGQGYFVPKELGCLQLGVLYSPLMKVPRVFPPEQRPGDLVRGMNTINKCRFMCEADPGCAHYSIQFPLGLCRMALDTARPLPNMFTVSGDRDDCKASTGLQNVLDQNAAEPNASEASITLNDLIAKNAVGTGLQSITVHATTHADSVAATLLPVALLLLAFSSTLLAVRFAALQRQSMMWFRWHGNNNVAMAPETDALLTSTSSV